MSEEHAHYHPGGVPITPQARNFGYEFPVHTSKRVWNDQCVWVGALNYNTHTEKRIQELLQYCYDGMSKKLAVQDDFVSYTFKAWYFNRAQITRNGRKLPKKKRARLAARLFLEPGKDTPWLYIFNPEEDTFDELTKGTDTGTGAVADEDTSGRSETDRSAVHVHGEIGDFLDDDAIDSIGKPVDEYSDGQD